MTRVTVNRRGLQDLLRGQGTANMLRQAARPVEATAKATAPLGTVLPADGFRCRHSLLLDTVGSRRLTPRSSSPGCA